MLAPEHDQQDAFEATREVLEAFVDHGHPTTLLAFGQTGSGKTSRSANGRLLSCLFL